LTCVVGFIDKEKGVTYIGADSLGSNGYSKTVRNDKKLFKLKDTPEAILGYTSSYRMGQLLMYADNLIDELSIKNDKINHEYLVTRFIPNIITLFEKGGYSRNNSGEKEGGVFLLGYKDSLYKIEADFQVGISSDNYNATGCGEEYALGSLKTTENMDFTPVERIHLALQSASKFSVGVAPPYYIINTRDDSVIELFN
jgi:ATP-dependent protease HslVU (ClpYQ) peptidase subunit